MSIIDLSRRIKRASRYGTMYYGLLGAAGGAGLGAATSSVAGLKSPGYAALAGAAGGGLLSAALRSMRNKSEEQDRIDDLERNKAPDQDSNSDYHKIRPGVYYASRNVFLTPKESDIPVVGEKSRHAFITSISNNKPKDDIPAKQLPNGQWVTTFSPSTDPDLKRTAVALNGDTGIEGIGNDNDFKILSNYVAKKRDDENMFGDARLYRLTDTDDEQDKATRTILKDVKNQLGKGIGEYALWGDKDYQGSCLNMTASMLSRINADKSRLPKVIGDWGHINSEDIDKYHDLLDKTPPDVFQRWNNDMPKWLPKCFYNAAIGLSK